MYKKRETVLFIGLITVLLSCLSAHGRELNFFDHKILWNIFSIIDPQDECTDVRFEGKNAIHTIEFDNQPADNFLREIKNSSSFHYIERNFFINLVSHIKTKEEIEFLRKLGEQGYDYIVILKSPKETVRFRMKARDLKDTFHWNQ